MDLYYNAEGILIKVVGHDVVPSVTSAISPESLFSEPLPAPHAHMETAIANDNTTLKIFFFIMNPPNPDKLFLFIVHKVH